MGMPKLGVNGAAIATVIARIVEFLFIVGYTYCKKLTIGVNPKYFFHIENQTVKQYFRYGLFIILTKLSMELAIPYIILLTNTLVLNPKLLYKL